MWKCSLVWCWHLMQLHSPLSDGFLFGAPHCFLEVPFPGGSLPSVLSLWPPAFILLGSSVCTVRDFANSWAFTGKKGPPSRERQLTSIAFAKKRRRSIKCGNTSGRDMEEWSLGSTPEVKNTFSWAKSKQHRLSSFFKQKKIDISFLEETFDMISLHKVVYSALCATGCVRH